MQPSPLRLITDASCVLGCGIAPDRARTGCGAAIHDAESAVVAQEAVTQCCAVALNAGPQLVHVRGNVRCSTGIVNQEDSGFQRHNFQILVLHRT